ncbi:hypothetical protein EW146_g4912, partial [Bondarzewia mesenterica]
MFVAAQLRLASYRNSHATHVLEASAPESITKYCYPLYIGTGCYPEQAAHDARKAARRSKKDSRKRRRREQGEQDARKWASDEEDNSGTGCGPPPPPGPSCSYDPDAIRAEIEE